MLLVISGSSGKGTRTRTVSLAAPPPMMSDLLADKRSEILVDMVGSDIHTLETLESKEIYQ